MAGEAQEDVLPFAKLKQVLSLCEKQPIGCAFGLTKDKKDCMLLVDKAAKPKKLASMIKTSGKAHLDVQTVRFGRVEVDVANEPGTLKFTVNKSEVGGTIVTLNKLAKRAGYSAIVINPDASLESEGEDESIPPPPPPPAAGPAVDAAALKARLTALVTAMMQRLPKDPANKDRLTTLAKTANIQLGTNNYKTAIELMDGLEKMLAMPLPAASPEPPPSPGAGTVAFAKARLAWLGTRNKLESDLETLRAAIQDYYKDDSVARRIDKAYQSRVKPILQTLDESLADMLDEARNATDPAKRDKLVQQARDKLAAYQNFIGAEPLFEKLDANPFVPLTTGKTMTGTLAALSAALR